MAMQLSVAFYLFKIVGLLIGRLLSKIHRTPPFSNGTLTNKYFTVYNKMHLNLMNVFLVEQKKRTKSLNIENYKLISTIEDNQQKK